MPLRNSPHLTIERWPTNLQIQLTAAVSRSKLQRHLQTIRVLNTDARYFQNDASAQTLHSITALSSSVESNVLTCLISTTTLHYLPLSSALLYTLRLSPPSSVESVVPQEEQPSTVFEWEEETNSSNEDKSESLSDDDHGVHPGSGSSDESDDDDTASLVSSITKLSSGECKLGYYNRSTH